MVTSNTKKDETAGPANKGLKVVAKRASFWRGGIQWGAESKTVPLANLTPDQAAAIRAEGEDGGMLVVTEVDIEPPTEAAKA